MAKISKLDQRMNADELMDSIAKGDGRVAAIVAGAWLDELLFGVLQHNFIQMSKGDEEELFEGNGPLSSFSGRIKTAYALGLISRKLRSDLDAIRAIRNDYAHQLRSVGLDYQAFRNRIVDLNALSQMLDKSDKPPGELLAHAVHLIGLFLIARTAPSHYCFDDDFCSSLKGLDYSDAVSVKRRDAPSDKGS